MNNRIEAGIPQEGEGKICSPLASYVERMKGLGVNFSENELRDMQERYNGLLIAGRESPLGAVERLGFVPTDLTMGEHLSRITQEAKVGFGLAKDYIKKSNGNGSENRDGQSV